jgi:NitT/TauT family transport system substrate-binding protein
MQLLSKFRIPFASLVAGVLLAGCGAPPNATTGGAPGQEEALSQITIGYTPTIVLPQPLLGIEEKKYAQFIPKTTFEGRVYDAGSGVIEALRAGAIDIGASGPYPALKAYAKAKDIVLLANAADGGTELMVLQSSPYKSVKDLKGKAVGVNQLGSTVDAFVRHNLLKAGLKPDDDVQIIRIPPGEQAALLQSGQVAAVAAPSPWPSQVAITAKARPLLGWKQILSDGHYSSGSIYTTKRFADEHPEFIKQFLIAHKQITDELNKDRVKGDTRVLAAWSKVSNKTLAPAVAKAAFATIKYNIVPDGKDLQNQADIAFETGGLKQKADLAGFIYEVK